MKKFAAVVMSFMMVVLCLTGCGGSKFADSAYLGTWTATTAEMSGIELSVDSLFENFDLTLDETGKAVLNINGDENKGKWEETDGGFLVDGELEFAVDGDVAVIDYEGVNITLERK